MKKIILVTYIILTGLGSFGQSFERTVFEYESMPQDSLQCSEVTNQKLNEVLVLLDRLKSEQAAETAKNIYEETDKCPAIYDIYSWALFRSGNWEKSMEIIDSAIIHFGSTPDLILRRAYMNIEMAELGIGVRNIDGNSVYLAEGKRLNYDDSIFSRQNYLAALNDFKYLSDTYENRSREIFLTGYIYQKLSKYNNSTVYLSKLSENEEYADDASLLIVDNYVGLENYNEAEKKLKRLEEKYPRSPKIQGKFSELYEISGDEEKLEIAELKSNFFSWVPEFCDLEYSKGNYETILFFLSKNDAEKKIKKLEKLQDNENAADIYLTVLNAHANHGNGVEEKAKELLIEIGSPVVPKTISLLYNARSTCTVTKAASILAEIKDPRGWQPMVDYLPRMENMPFTMIPPEVPAQIIKFDKEKGLTVLLEWIKDQLDEQESNSDGPMGELGGIFSASSIYGPLSSYSKKEIRKAANDLEYSEDQIEKLLDKIFK